MLQKLDCSRLIDCRTSIRVGFVVDVARLPVHTGWAVALASPTAPGGRIPAAPSGPYPSVGFLAQSLYQQLWPVEASKCQSSSFFSRLLAFPSRSHRQNQEKVQKSRLFLPIVEFLQAKISSLFGWTPGWCTMVTCLIFVHSSLAGLGCPLLAI